MTSSKKLFEILIRENADMLMTMIRAITHDQTLADDIFQETMLTAWRRLDDYDQSLPFGPWLRGIARRLILAHRSRSARGMLYCGETTLDYIGTQVPGRLPKPLPRPRSSQPQLLSYRARSRSITPSIPVSRSVRLWWGWKPCPS